MYYGGAYYARFWYSATGTIRTLDYCRCEWRRQDPTYGLVYGFQTWRYEITDIKTQYDKQLVFTAGLAACMVFTNEKKTIRTRIAEYHEPCFRIPDRKSRQRGKRAGKYF